MPSPSDIKAGLAAAASKAASGTHRAQAGAPPPGGPQGVFDLNGTPVSSVNTGPSLKTTTVGGISQIDEPGDWTAITETPIAAGAGVTTIWSLAVGASQDVTVTAKLRCTCNDGISGKRLQGTIVCTAKRFGSGALAIASQSAALPWQLDDPAWLPQFTVSGNTLSLQVTADSYYAITPRGIVGAEVTDTSVDAAPAHTVTWLSAQLQAALGSKLEVLSIPEDFTLSSTNITAATSRVGLTLTTMATKATAVTRSNRVYSHRVGAGTTTGKCFYNASVVAIKSVFAIIAIDSLPFAGGYGGFAVTPTAFAAAFLQAVNATSGWVSGGRTISRDGTLTATAATGTHVYQCDVAANAGLGLEIGGIPDASLGTYDFTEGDIGVVVACNAVPTAPEAAAVLAILQTWQTGA